MPVGAGDDPAGGDAFPIGRQVAFGALSDVVCGGVAGRATVEGCFGRANVDVEAPRTHTDESVAGHRQHSLCQRRSLRRSIPRGRVGSLLLGKPNR